MNPKWEINRLRTVLLMQGLPENSADRICDQAASEINEAILGIVQNAVQEAAQIGVGLGAHEFVADLGVREVGDSFYLMTHSGRTDYSEPPFPMLPHLLKHGKTADDGSRYRVIPVEGKSNKPRNTVTDLFSVMKSMSDKAQQARDAMNDRSGAELDSAPAPRVFASDLTTGYKPPSQYRDKVLGSKPNFRTASSKQNPQTQWVKPGKELNMTGTIMDINSKMQAQIVEAVSMIIRRHGG